MNKQERFVVIALFFALLAWGFYGRKQKQNAPPPPPSEIEVVSDAASASPADPAPAVVAKASSNEEAAAPVVTTSLAPETFCVLTNDVLQLTFSSHYGAIVRAELNQFDETLEGESHVVLDLERKPALSLGGEVFGGAGDYEMTVNQARGSVQVMRAFPSGITLRREIRLVDDYRLEVVDRFENGTNMTVEVPSHSLAVGPMSSIQSKAQVKGISYLGIDALPASEEAKVKHWGKKLGAIYGVQGSRFSCGRVDATGLPFDASRTNGIPARWVASKNKYFVQILSPGESTSDYELFGYRNRDFTNRFEVKSVAASLLFPSRVLGPGEQHERVSSFYIGPKKYDRLKALGQHQAEVMQFGWWDWYRGICRLLLWTLNWIYALIPNYGIAIILLTVIVRLLFWPITHKSMVHMKRMKELQPLMTEIRKKHKDDPQKMNQEVMTLYKIHKVNPMAGCLPMVAQIPVFVALFTVLRSAVELRFAGFLWIGDLSEPEGLLREVIGFPINILPLVMTATTILQQRLTPTAGDPQQQKMMMFMPVIFLFLFYNMPSALVLYWSTSQLLAIVQLLMQQKGDKQAQLASGPEAEPDSLKPMEPPRKSTKKRKKR